MQSVNNGLVPSMLAARANREKPPLDFFCESYFVELQQFVYSISFFIPSYFTLKTSQKISLQVTCSNELTLKRYV